MQPVRVLLVAAACLAGAAAQTRFSQHSSRQPIRASANNDQYYIMLDGMSVFSCNGVENRFTIDRRNIRITDDYGNEAHYIRGPGAYNIEFSRVEVPAPLENLAGEIGASLQVPVFEGPGGLRFDLPYQVIPEVGIINAKCDEQSGVIEHQGQRIQKYFCRYCNLCATATDVSRTVERDAQKFIPELETGKESTDDLLEPVCGKVDAKTYSLKRRINLPTKQELEEAGKRHFSGISDDVKKRLEKGTGRFHVFLNLITSDRSPNQADDFFTANGPCQCFSSRYRQTLQCQIKSISQILFRNAEQCKADYVNQCLEGNYHTAACYTVEFNYRLAFDYDEVRLFLARKGLKDTLGVKRVVATTPAARTEDQVKDECIQAIPSAKVHVQRYCKVFWDSNKKLCCQQCPSVC